MVSLVPYFSSLKTKENRINFYQLDSCDSLTIPNTSIVPLKCYFWEFDPLQNGKGEKNGKTRKLHGFPRAYALRKDI